MKHEEVFIPAGSFILPGEIFVPDTAKGIVIFSHGSGSSRLSSRNRMVASFLNKSNIATLLFDLLTTDEDKQIENRFNINLLTERLATTAAWVERHSITRRLSIGFFGASTGAASAMQAAAGNPKIAAIVSRGGRPDLAMDFLDQVKAATLLIVGGLDSHVIKLNSNAYTKLSCEKEMVIIEGATHLFEEPGKMEEVCTLAAAWFKKYL